MDLDAYDRLIGGIYEAGVGGASLEGMFHMIQVAVGAEAAGVSVYDEADDIITHTLIASRRSLPHRVVKQVQALNAEPGARLVTAARPHAARRFTDLVPDERLLEATWYRRQVELTGMGYGMVADAQVCGLRIRLFAARRARRPNFDTADVERLGRIARHVERAFTDRARRFSPFRPPRELISVVYHPNRVASAFLDGNALQLRWAERLKLTPAETRVLAVMARGPGRQAAAVELGVGLETLRSHIRRIYAKAGVRRLSELVLMLQQRECAETRH